MRDEVLAIVVARSGSTRLPGKMFLAFSGGTVIESVLRRARLIPGVNQVVLATGDSTADDAFLNPAQRLGIPVFRGSENDVVSRMTGAAQAIAPQCRFVVRVCADNPLFCPDIVGAALQELKQTEADVITPAEYPTLPFGFSQVVMRTDCLEYIDRTASQPVHREHVENFCYDNAEDFVIRYQQAAQTIHFPELILTLDYAEDFQRLCFVDGLIKDLPLRLRPPALIEKVKACRIAFGGMDRELQPGLGAMVKRNCTYPPVFLGKPDDAAGCPEIDLAVCTRRPSSATVTAPRGAVWVEEDDGGPTGLTYSHPRLKKPYAIVRLPGPGLRAGDYLTRVLPAVLNRLLSGFPPRTGAHEVALPCREKTAGHAVRKGFSDFYNALFPSRVLLESADDVLSSVVAELRFWEVASGRTIGVHEAHRGQGLRDPFTGLRVCGDTIFTWKGDVAADALERKEKGPSLAEIWNRRALQQDRVMYMNDLHGKPKQGVAL